MKDLCLNNKQLYDMIGDENERQLNKWGIQDHLPSEWVMFTVEELGELAEAIREWNYRYGDAREVVKEAIQTATLSLKIAEMFQNIVKNGDR
jgi:NTP pyrophosphatase (non-canonical NTP hydrolase)